MIEDVKHPVTHITDKQLLEQAEYLMLLTLSDDASDKERAIYKQAYTTGWSQCEKYLSTFEQYESLETNER